MRKIYGTHDENRRKVEYVVAKKKVKMIQKDWSGYFPVGSWNLSLIVYLSTMLLMRGYRMVSAVLSYAIYIRDGLKEKIQTPNLLKVSSRATKSQDESRCNCS